MSVITWPATLRAPAECTISQARYDMVEASDATGHRAARLFGPPRWRMALRSIDAFSLAEAGQWEALLLQLRGGVNHLAAWDPVRTQPQGTLRGAVTLLSTTAAGATSTFLNGCASAGNLLRTPSYEVDTDSNGIAEDWTLYDSGMAGTVTAAPGTASGGGRGQRVSATAMNTGPSSAVGLEQTVPGISAGQPYTLAVDELSATASQIQIFLQWLDAALSVISTSSASFTASTSAFARRTLTATAPAGAANVRVLLQMHSNPSLGTAESNFDSAQLELGSVANAVVGPPTLLAGDWLQIGTGLGTSQLVKCVADATGTSNALMSVSFEPPLRQAFSGGTVVTWNKPLAYYKQTGTPQWSYRPGRRMRQQGFALDLLEAFA